MLNTFLLRERMYPSGVLCVCVCVCVADGLGDGHTPLCDIVALVCCDACMHVCVCMCMYVCVCVCVSVCGGYVRVLMECVGFGNRKGLWIW